MLSKKSITLGVLAREIGAELKGDPKKQVYGISTLKEASAEEISFLIRDSYSLDLERTNAAAVIISRKKYKDSPCDALIGDNPKLLYAKATHIFKDFIETNTSKNISELAEVSPSASISSSATIDSFCSIGEGVEVGDDVVIGSSVVINNHTKIGSGTKIYPNCTLYDCISVGSHCIIHSGSVIGSDGLGFVKDKERWVKIEHLGKVVIGDRVEIGSNSSIDRGSVGSTIIGNDVKIDNLVHIAHNVVIGSGTAIAANSAIAGSTIIGRNCTIAGCCGIVDNIEITDSVNITAMTLVTKSIKTSGTYSSGTPLMDNREWRKNAVAFKKLKDFISKEGSTKK